METGKGTNDPATKKAWEEKLFRDAMPLVYWKNMMGSGNDSPVQVNTALEKDQGDEVTFTLINRLVGAGVVGDDILSGNEEELDDATFKVALQQYRHGVKSAGALSRQRAVWEMQPEARAALKQWMAEKIDQLCFSALVANPTQIAYRDGTGVNTYANSLATATAALNATNSRFNMNFFSYLATLAQTGRGRDFKPLNPIKVNGGNFWVFVCHPDVLFDIKTDTNFQQAQREAQERGKDHPIFTGATAVYDGIVVRAHEFMPKALNGGGGSVPWAQCALMGTQALAWAWGTRPEANEEETDHKNKKAWSIRMIAGVRKPTFDGRDFGSLGVAVARTNVSN